jgi:hypothetical protein
VCLYIYILNFKLNLIWNEFENEFYNNKHTLSIYYSFISTTIHKKKQIKKKPSIQVDLNHYPHGLHQIVIPYEYQTCGHKLITWQPELNPDY